ncbi:MAG: CBS domain-containing protein [Alphaproteobacteria bacterium]|nr:CBS domain-containing protein [Alphaproteobacteria bacterium]
MVETTNDATDPPSRRRAGLLQRWTRIFARGKLGSAEAVEEALREREENGGQMEMAHKDLILRAAHFDQLKVADVMRARAEIVAIEASATLGEAARVFSESQHSRLPIYGETLDDPQGFIHVRDVLAQLAPNEQGVALAQFEDTSLARIKREILFVPQSMTLARLFLRMQSSRIHLALVVDEYGGTDGLVSMEDLVEQIVGAIDDEHDVDAALVVERANGAFEADGRASISELEEKLGKSLAIPDHEDEFDTAAGLAVALAARLPQRGEILPHPAGFDVEIVDADPRRVKRIRIKPASEAQPTLRVVTPAENATHRGP